MYLKDRQSGDLVEILEMDELVDPCTSTVPGRLHAGEELQEPAQFAKTDLVFPSGEDLPRCWRDPHYRDAEIKR
ncbi:MAG TPA: acetyltransferase [Gammaproteobacteria bacterium]|nr:acetyltransferase [Gammaproteobacteria bacterium]